MANKQTIESTEARDNWNVLLRKVHDERVRLLIEKDGVVVAGIVSAEDLQHLELLESDRERRFAILHKMSKAFEDVPPDELQREVDKAVAEVIAEMRAERERA